MSRPTRLSSRALRRLWIGCAVAIVASALRSDAQEGAPSPPDVAGEEIAAPQTASQSRVVVIRIAGKLLEDAVNRDINVNFPIETQLLDAWCEGSGTASGTVAMDFAGAKLEEPLPVRVSGTMFSRAKGYARPVVTTTRTNTTFDAVFNIDFDGKKFFQTSSWVKADCDSTIESICATTRVGRRLIQRVAWRVAPGEVPRYDYAGARMAEAEIDDQAGETIQASLSQLNQAINLEATLARLGATASYQRHVSKTKTYIQARIAPQGNDNPLPPRDEMLSDSPIEIWIHPNSDRPILAELAVQWGSAQGVLRKLLPGLPQLPDAPSIAVIDDWDIIKVGRLPTLPRGIGAETD